MLENARLQFLNDLRNDREHVSYDPKICEVKDWGVFILVDGNNGLRSLHTGTVLYRT